MSLRIGPCDSAGVVNSIARRVAPWGPVSYTIIRDDYVRFVCGGVIYSMQGELDESIGCYWWTVRANDWLRTDPLSERMAKRLLGYVRDDAGELVPPRGRG